MELSKMFSIDLKDVGKGALIAVLTGAILPVSMILQEPSFSVANANWSLIFDLAMNGAIAGFFSYLIKNFLSDDKGKVLGRF